MLFHHHHHKKKAKKYKKIPPILLDLNNTYHKLFFQELLALSDAEDSVLLKLDCYKNVTNMGPLRKSALKALAACHYITDTANREKILNILFKVMEKNNADIQDAAYECMKKFFSGIKCEKDIVSYHFFETLVTKNSFFL